MKRIVGFFVLILLISNLYGQSISQENVPAVILNIFQVKFPNAKNIKWRLEMGNYRVDYKVNNKPHKLTLNNRGKVIKHFQDLYVSEIPKSVLETIRSRQPYFDINDADKIEKDGNITYEVSFKVDGKNRVFWTNSSGELIKYRKELKDNEVPAQLIKIINSDYGILDIKKAKYVEEMGTYIYIIRGKINDEEHVFKFDKKFNVSIHTQKLKDSKIPMQVLISAKKEYAGYEIRGAFLVENAGASTYILDLKKSKKRVKVTFDEKGTVVKVKKY